jgi:hypothetical protein
MDSRRLTIADLPTFRIYPLDHAEADANARRDAARLAARRAKVLAALRDFGRELTSGEIASYVLSGLPGPALREILDGLVAEDRVKVRTVACPQRGGQLSRVYRLPGQGGGR